MSRKVNKISDTTRIVSGNDVALGVFVDVIDTRYDKDPSGEGFLMEWSSAFGFAANLIDLDAKEFGNPNLISVVLEKVETFIKKQTKD